VENETGQRLYEKQVGERYGRWQVSANSVIGAGAGAAVGAVAGLAGCLISKFW
jgi:hypothetical protein